MESATPLMPDGNLSGSGSSSPVVLERPVLTSQQSSTDSISGSGVNNWDELTVDVFVTSFFETQADY
jgi:hypothetical protein